MPSPAPLANDRLLRALAGEPVDRTPVWLMRQAGRYLPEYREVRAAAGSFMALCQDPDRACQVTLQPLERFDLDAAILFSDILTIPDAMGLGLHFVEGEGPRLAEPLRRPADIDRLAIPDPEDALAYVPETVRRVRAALAGRVPLIGFAGSPWTLATYMIEGGSSREFSRAKGLLYEEPAALHRLLAKLAAAVSAYLNAQIAAGAQAVMVFDTWGGALAADAYREFSLAYMKRVVAGLTREAEGRRVPAVLFTKGAGPWLEWIAETGCDGIGLDWTVPIGEARRRLGGRVALQGNLDPAVLHTRPEVIRREAAKILADYGPQPGHVFNLGHGVQPRTPPEHVEALVTAVHELSPAYHGTQSRSAPGTR